MTDHELEQGRRDVATACRILAHAGLAEDVLGHVSIRLDESRLLVRCRGPEERGLLFTYPGDVHVVDLDGQAEVPVGYAVPNELPIHTELLRNRPDAGAVVHAHPPAVVAADLASVPLVPLVGAYNIPATRMAAHGIPVFPRSVLIRTRVLGGELATAMADADAGVLRGHGIATTGPDVRSAVARALSLDALARMALSVARAGGVPEPIPAPDLAELPDLGPGLNDDSIWRHHLGRLRLAGLAL